MNGIIFRNMACFTAVVLLLSGSSGCKRNLRMCCGWSLGWQERCGCDDQSCTHQKAPGCGCAEPSACNHAQVECGCKQPECGCGKQGKRGSGLFNRSSCGGNWLSKRIARKSQRKCDTCTDRSLGFAAPEPPGVGKFHPVPTTPPFGSPTPHMSLPEADSEQFQESVPPYRTPSDGPLREDGMPPAPESTKNSPAINPAKPVAHFSVLRSNDAMGSEPSGGEQRKLTLLEPSGEQPALSSVSIVQVAEPLASKPQGLEPQQPQERQDASLRIVAPANDGWRPTTRRF